MSIFGIHVCMDEIRAAWPIAFFVLPTIALVRGFIHSRCKKHR